MAALLVAMSVMAIMLSAAMPVWKQLAQREKEEELVFRGRQYVHAIGLFQRKFANAAPASVDALVEQRFLRKKFKDPITGDDFVPLGIGQVAPGLGQPQPAPSSLGSQPVASSGQGSPFALTTAAQPGGRGAVTPAGGIRGASGTSGGTTGGIIGVTSRSKDQSIRLYNGRGHYNEWAFVSLAQSQQPGGGQPGTAIPGALTGSGQRGQPVIGVPPQGGTPPGRRGRAGQRGPVPLVPGHPFGGGRGSGPGSTPAMPISPPRGGS